MPTAQIWTGAGSSVAAVYTVTIGGSPSGGNTFTLTGPNGKSVTYTAVGGDTTATVAAALEALAAASTEPEFAECTFAYPGSGASFTVTGPSDGAPISFSTSTSGGSISGSTTTSPLSPHDYTYGANWLSGSAPGASDSVTFDGTSSVPVKYTLAGLNTTSLSTWTRRATYTGTIGLPDENPAGYQEWRPTYCAVDSTSILIQQAAGDTAFAVRVQGTNASATTVTVVGQSGGGGGFTFGGGGQTNADNVVELYGLPTGSILNAVNADVGVASYAGQTCSLSGGCTFNNCTGYIGAGATLGAVTVDGGSPEVDASYSTLTILGGATVTVGIAAAASSTTTIQNGTLSWQSTGNLSPVTIGASGTLDMSDGPAVITQGTITLLPGATLNDPYKLLTRSVTLTCTNCTMSELNLNLGTSFTLTVS